MFGLLSLALVWGSLEGQSASRFSLNNSDIIADVSVRVDFYAAANGGTPVALSG